MRRSLIVAALMLAAAPSWAAALSDDLFGVTGIKADNISSFTKWVGVLSRIRDENARVTGCLQNPDECTFTNGPRWQAMMERAKEANHARQLQIVNSYFNTFPYIEDIDNYGRSDFWATLLGFLRKSGDCEDYAIAKFVSLRKLGWSNASLRVVIVKDTVRGMNHAVLAANLGDDDMILDNLASEPLPSATVLQYSPYYAVNETSRWIFLRQAQ